MMQMLHGIGPTLRPAAPAKLALALSLIAHAGVLAALMSIKTELPRLDAFKTIEVTLLGETAADRNPPRRHRHDVARRPPVDSDHAGASASTGDHGAARGEETTVAARYDATALDNPKPPYPRAARRRGHEGRVVLNARVRSDGVCTEVTLKLGSGHALLDTAALDTVRRWRFIPARRAGTAIDSWVEVPIVFRLEG